MKKEKLDIIYEDKNILVVNKPAHLLTVSTNHEAIETLYHKVYVYLKQKNKNNKVFIVHRLDKDTSGIVLFAKREEVKKLYQENWNKLARTRGYIAIVEGRVEKGGTIKVYLNQNHELHSYVTDESHGKLAITNYDVITSSKNYSILNVFIETGRKNQIRASLEYINHPIIGDRKYGSTKNPLRRICLHANFLEIEDPITHNIFKFSSKVPKEFKIFYV